MGERIIEAYICLECDHCDHELNGDCPECGGTMECIDFVPREIQLRNAPDHRGASVEEQEMSDYDPGILSDFGAGNVSWWHDYIRSEINRCNDYWRSSFCPPNGG